jgi:hypothetical protein
MEDPQEGPLKKSRSIFHRNDDEKLLTFIHKYGTNRWDRVAAEMEDRNARQCRERWKHFLSKKYEGTGGFWRKDEDEIIILKVQQIGNKWTQIAKYFPGRTDLQIKTRYNQLKNRQPTHKEIKSTKSLPAPPLLAFNETVPETEAHSSEFAQSSNLFDFFDDSYDL